MNNFDKSSSGVNLELSCFQDGYMSRSNWDENFMRLKGMSDTFQFIDCGIFPERDLDDIENYSGVTKAKILEVLDQECYVNLEGMREDARGIYDKPLSKLTRMELTEWMEQSLYEQYGKTDTIEFYQEYFTPKYEVMQVTGYSQGDQADVIFYHEDMEQYTNQGDNFIRDMRIYFAHMFYDAPIYCRLTIDGDDFEFMEYIEAEYNCDKDDLIQIATKHITHDKKDYIIEWLGDNLPSQPEYIG